VLTEDERALGTVLVDLGGETISVAVYMNGTLRHLKELPFGCDLITADLVWGLHTSREIARTVIEKYAVACADCLPEDEVVSISGNDGHCSKEFRLADIVDIVNPRVEELLEMVHEEIVSSGYAKMLSSAVLTGGGTLLRGVDVLASTLLRVPQVRTASIKLDTATMVDAELRSPTYSSAIALSVYHLAQTNKHNTRGGRKAANRLLAMFDKFNIFNGD